MKGIVATLVVLLGVSTYARVPGSRITLIGVDQCPKDQETNWEIEWLMRHEDCNKFYKCAFGQPVEYKCYGNLYFNLETWQCDWPHNVDCEDRNIPEPETTTSASTTTSSTTTTTTPAPTTTTSTTTTTTPAPTTTTSTTTTTTPAPTTTTSTTTTTTPAPTTTTTTPAPTTTTTTTTPAPTTTTTTTTPAPTTTTTTTTPAPTTTTTTTTPAPTTTTTTTTPAPTTTSTTTTTTTPAPTTEAPATDIEFQENGCPVDPHIHWLLPHEYDCNLFYYCVWGQKVLRECPATLHFNTVLQVCDHQVDAGCTLSGAGRNSVIQWFSNLL